MLDAPSSPPPAPVASAPPAGVDAASPVEAAKASGAAGEGTPPSAPVSDVAPPIAVIDPASLPAVADACAAAVIATTTNAGQADAATAAGDSTSAKLQPDADKAKDAADVVTAAPPPVASAVPPSANAFAVLIPTSEPVTPVTNGGASDSTPTPAAAPMSALVGGQKPSRPEMPAAAAAATPPMPAEDPPGAREATAVAPLPESAPDPKGPARLDAALQALTGAAENAKPRRGVAGDPSVDLPASPHAPARAAAAAEAALPQPGPAQNPVTAAAPASAPANIAIVRDHTGSIPLAGVAIEIVGRAREGKKQFDIRLDPPELGRIDVRLHVDHDGNVTSRLIVERADTLDLLRRDAPKLEQALQSAGLKTGGDSLSFSLRDQGSQDRGGRDPSPPGRLIVADGDTPLQSRSANYGRWRSLGGGLDIRV